MKTIPQKRKWHKANILSGLSAFVGNLKSGKRDSNPRPLAWEANALPTELLPLKKFAGTEPATYPAFGGRKLSLYQVSYFRLSKRTNWKQETWNLPVDGLPGELLPLITKTKLR
jgi:hypothetical protein